MRCPGCGQENEETSAFCFQCGAQLRAVAAQPQGGPDPPPGSGGPPGLQTAPAPPGAPAPVARAPEAPPAPLPPGAAESETVLTHRGEIFGLGYGPDYYAVWDLRRAGEPVARFDSSPVGWEAAWRRFHELERINAVPGWRQPQVGWILLHVAIGLIGLASVQLFVLGFVLTSAGRDVQQPTAAAGWGIALAMVTGLASWLMFAYLRGSPVLRWAVFLGLLVGGFLAALVIALAAQPAAAG